jgi:hypothetical protein
MHLDRLQGLLDHVNHVAVATRCVESVSPRRG